MEPITIHLKDESGFGRHGEAVQLGAPFARGEVTSAVDIRLRYPFTRGTGSYLNALRGASIVESSGDWLRQAEQVVVATFHSAKAIKSRHIETEGL